MLVEPIYDYHPYQTCQPNFKSEWQRAAVRFDEMSSKELKMFRKIPKVFTNTHASCT